MTDEAIEEERRQSDTAIACQLVRGGYLTTAQFDVWQRARAGETLYRIRRDYPNESRGGGFFAASTLYKWCHEVEAAIKAARVAEEPAEHLPSPWGISVADGHDVRRAGDPTPAGRVSTEQSTWDAERLRAAGAMDRYSRRRG